MVTVKAVTHPGLVRRVNEDGFFFDVELGLFLVADGMGGHNAGEIASRLALESIEAFVRRTKDDEEFTWPFGVETELSFDANRVRTALRLANRRVFQTSESGVQYYRHGHDGRLGHHQQRHDDLRDGRRQPALSREGSRHQPAHRRRLLAGHASRPGPRDRRSAVRAPPAPPRHHQGHRHARRDRSADAGTRRSSRATCS